MSGGTITICGDTVIKTGASQSLRVEVEKTRRAHEISERCGLFRVPRVLEYDQAGGTARFEYIRNIKTLREVTASGGPPASFMDRLGQSMAVVHKELTLPDDMVVPVEQDYRLAGSEVFLHGDLGPGNVCVNTSDSQIILLDWRAGRKPGEEATYGSRYFDLMWFVYNLFHRPLGRARYKAAVAAEPMAAEFLRGYFSLSEYAYDHQEMVNYAKNFLHVRKQGLHLKRRFLLALSHRRFLRFVVSFHP